MGYDDFEDDNEEFAREFAKLSAGEKNYKDEEADVYDINKSNKNKSYISNKDNVKQTEKKLVDKKQVEVDTKKSEEKKEKKVEKEKEKDEDNNSNFGEGPNEGDKDDNNPYFYAKEIMKNNKFICFYGEEILYWYDFKSGKYYMNGESIVKKFVQNISNKDYRGVRKNHVAETIELIKRNFLRPKPYGDEYKHILLVGNGIIDTSTLKNQNDPKVTFHPYFNNKYFILSGVPWKYDPNADCPRINKFLIELVIGIDRCSKYSNWGDLFASLSYDEKNKVRTLPEFIGYCLLRSCDFKKCIILKGGPDSGKSKFTDLVEKFLGYESCSGVSLQEMRQEYNIAEIYGKMANIRAELSGKRLEDTSIVKIFINGDPVTGRIIRSRPIRFQPHAKLIFATNIFPAVSMNEDNSFFGKIIVIMCPNAFPRNDAFFDYISIPEEMSGLLNVAIRGLERLMTNKRFSYEPSADEIAKWFPRYSEKGGHRYASENF